MNTPQKPSARSSVPQSPAPRTSDAPARRRAGNVGTNTLITVASLLATAGGWAWISHTEKLADAAADSFIVAAPAQPAADTRQVAAPLVLESIPTLVPQLQVQLPAEQRPARAAAQAARVVQTDVQPALRQVDPAAVAAIVPTAAPQVQVALQPQAAAAQPVQVAPAPQAAIAQPVQVAPAPQAPAPVTRTRSSRRRTR